MDLVLRKEDLDQIHEILDRMLKRSGAHTVLLIDRSGQLISNCGEKSPEDSVALAALTAANFGATSEIAKMLGEKDFSLLFHKGKEENIHFSAFEEDFILISLFDNDASLGLVRLEVDRAIKGLQKILSTATGKSL